MEIMPMNIAAKAYLVNEYFLAEVELLLIILL